MINIAHIAILIAALALAVPFGRYYMARVFTGQKHVLTPVLGPVEKALYRICGIDAKREMSLKTYILSLIGFEVLVIVFVFLVMELQGFLP